MTRDNGALEAPEPTVLSARRGGLTPEQGRSLFTQHCDYVWNTLRRLGIDRADLEDLTHDTFVAVLGQWHCYDPTRPLRPWLFVFALRVASDHRRRARHRFEVSSEGTEASDQSPSAVELLLRKEREALAHAALQSIELSRRAVFILHELDGSSIPHIAAALEIPLPTAYSRLRLAREEFAAAVKRLSLRAR